MFLSGDTIQHGVEVDGQAATLQEAGEDFTAGGASAGCIS